LVDVKAGFEPYWNAKDIGIVAWSMTRAIYRTRMPR
jgi:hypothetical protein